MTITPERLLLPPDDPAEQHELTELHQLISQLHSSAVLADASGRSAPLPPALVEMLGQMVSALNDGRAVGVAPLAQTLTTQEAADILGVSRPTLVKLLAQGKIAYERPGSHRRIRLDDLLGYQARQRAERSRALTELIQQTEDLGLYEEREADQGQTS